MSLGEILWSAGGLGWRVGFWIAHGAGRARGILSVSFLTRRSAALEFQGITDSCIAVGLQSQDCSPAGIPLNVEPE